MIDPKPSWSFTAKEHLRLSYGHVHLLTDHVVGQWFVLNRNSGERLWERDFRRVNTIFEITNGVILVAETRSDGPWTADFGCYGISLATGAMLWRWYGCGVRGALARLFEQLPAVTNELRPGFYGVRGTEVATAQGHILDLLTGKLLRHESPISIPKKDYNVRSAAQKVYDGDAVEIGQNAFISTREPLTRREKRSNGRTMISTPKLTRPFGFVLRNEQGRVIWDWSPEDLGLHPLTRYYGWRLVRSKLLVLGGEEPPKIPTVPDSLRMRATKYHLIVLNALDGDVTENVSISDEWAESCRIEDVDEKGVLISRNNRCLDYYVFAW